MKYKIIANFECVKASVKYLLLESRLFEASDSSNQKPFHFTKSTQFLEIGTSVILVFHNDIATRYFRINVASHQNKKGFAMSFNSKFVVN